MKINPNIIQKSFDINSDRQIQMSTSDVFVNKNIQNSLMAGKEIMNDTGQPTREAFQIAVNKLNEFMEHTQKNSKFIFHEGLGKYYVEVVDAKTEEVIKEIPPKELLNAYYEMQKMLGNVIDRSI